MIIKNVMIYFKNKINIDIYSILYFNFVDSLRDLPDAI